MTEDDHKFNRGTALWKGKMLMEMSRQELYDAFNELGELYQVALIDKINHEQG